MQKIGVGIVTCNRPKFFLKCFKSIPQNVEIVVVNDGADFEDIDKLHKIRKFEYIHNKENLGVGKTKNKALKYLLEQNCNHIFLIEDDIIIKDPTVFDKYIEARNITGIQHFNFGYHGPANKNNISGGKPCPRFVVDYGNTKIAINSASVGAFCYYTREVLEKVGLIDEDFLNAFDHVDHDYRIFKAGYTTPYWNWPDLANSMDYLDEIECSEKSSAIRPRKDWQENFTKGAECFKKKHGYMPAWQGCVPDTTKEDVIKFLRSIKPK
jgi:GT2 family glycosyltransferase